MKVKSGLDSRIILDQNGGETLIGHGDMLYQSGSMFEPIRIQGCFVEHVEINNISAAAYFKQKGQYEEWINNDDNFNTREVWING